MAVFVCCCILVTASQAVADDEAIRFFEARIRPVLVEKCYECHSIESKKSQGELWLDSRNGIRKGGASGPAVVPGDIEGSLIIDALRYGSLQMPPEGKLDDAIIADFEKWIRMGAPDPREDVASPGLPKVDWNLAKEHWAFRPLPISPTPVALDSTQFDRWAGGPIDLWVRKQLDQHQLQPNPPASKEAWLRRVTYDLIGLPPTPEQLQAFLSDDGPDARHRVVDRLLTSPRYGERYGRHWLDLARYADSNGADENHGYPVAWRYRDYVIDAMNNDVPYDQFVVEQLAGDLLPAQTEFEQARLMTATGFLVIGPKMLAEQDKPKLVADLVDEQLDTVGKVFLGLTLGCARCHDHKFDPIRSEEYYALAGIFHSTRSMKHLEFVSQWNERELPDSRRLELIAEQRKRLAEAEAELRPIEQAISARVFEQSQEALDTLWKWKQTGVNANAESITALGIDDNQLKKYEKFLGLADWQTAKSLSALEDELVALIPQRDSIDNPEKVRLAVRAAMQEAWKQLIDVARNDQGEIKDRRLAKLYSSLYGGRGPFVPIEKLESVASESEKRDLLPAQQRVAELKKSMPEMDRAMAADEAPVKLVALHVRGNHLQQQGEPIQRRVPSILQEQTEAVVFPQNQSGRLELARWLVSPQHPLTARVMVNRIWQNHFGEGLVRSASNFGLKGDVPTHPELLDTLASEFTRHHWSMKWLHREIVLSSVYGMSSNQRSDGQLADPENRLLWRMNRRRLEVEPLRDSLIQIADEMDWSVGGQAQSIYGASFPDTQEARTLYDAARRTVYLPINRAALEELFATFDYVDSAVSLEKRPVTTVPHQSLFMMNHRLAMYAGWQLAKRLESFSSDDRERLKFAYANCFSRLPTEQETVLALEFLEQVRRETLPASVDQGPGPKPAWIRLCRSLLLTSEYLYID